MGGEETVCATHTPCHSAHSYLPIKSSRCQCQSIPGPPYFPDATAFLICFLHGLVLPVLELHVNGINQKALLCKVYVTQHSAREYKNISFKIRFGPNCIDASSPFSCHLTWTAIVSRTTSEIKMSHTGIQRQDFQRITQVPLSSLGPTFQIPVSAPKIWSYNHPPALTDKS